MKSRIFGTFDVNFLLAYLSFEHLKNSTIAHVKRIFTLKSSPEFSGAFFLAEIFPKVSFDPCNFRITRLSARKSEQMKNF